MPEIINAIANNFDHLLQNYLPQVLAGIWAVIFLAVLLLAWSALRTKEDKTPSPFERFSSFKYLHSGGRKRANLISDIRVEHYEDFYSTFKGLFIVHCYEPSRKTRKRYDIYIYIVGDPDTYLKEIVQAEFMFGKDWNNHIFTIKNDGGLIGIATSASKPFLCTCCVTLRDGRKLFMDRYIDFEMGIVFKRGAPATVQPYN